MRVSNLSNSVLYFEILVVRLVLCVVSGLLESNRLVSFFHSLIRHTAIQSAQRRLIFFVGRQHGHDLVVVVLQRGIHFYLVDFQLTCAVE